MNLNKTERTDRPQLSLELNSTIFREYYYLKDELAVFCRQMGLQSSGSKQVLTERIAHFLDTGEKLSSLIAPKSVRRIEDMTLKTRIEQNIVCSERHRTFFRQRIGKSFTFNVSFQKWLKSHAGNTYAEAVEAWWKIRREKKKEPLEDQFEYNTYIRDFFKDNPASDLQDAIHCWNYKKSLPGKHQYDREDKFSH